MTGVPLLLVDGHNLLFRACFGTPAQIWSRDPDGKRDLTTEFMFFALLRKGINSGLPAWPEVVVVFDGQDGSAQRKQADATLAASCPARDVLIASADQDYCQLVRDAGPGQGSVRVLNTARRAGSRLTGPAGVRARHGVTPAQFPDYRALAGDAADNIPGVRGIGAKTAAALLGGGLALEDLPASGRLAGRKGAAITAAWPQVLTWRDMIRMNDQVPVPAGVITGAATTPLPRPAEVIEKLGLWRRIPPAQQNEALW